MATLGYVQIADRYDTVMTGPRCVYSFETQESQPVDATNPMLRDLSPFTIFLLPPGGDTLAAELVTSYQTSVATESTDPNYFSTSFEFDPAAYAVANGVSDYAQADANNIRATFGISMVEPEQVSSYNTTISELEQTVALGRQMRQMGGGGEVIATLADSYTAADIALQVTQMLDVMPLTLLINPNDMAITYQSLQNYTDRGRNGFIFQRWGEAQPTVSFSGSTGAFLAAEATSSAATGGSATVKNVGDALLAATSGHAEAEASDGYTNVATGVQFATMRDSAAFQNFISLYHFYRNNGLIYDTLTETEAHLYVGAVAIHYDQWVYVGHIESFEFSFTDENQHRMEWSMEFTVDEMYDTATSPAVVLPMEAPQPNPAYPGRIAGRGGNSLSAADAVLSSNGHAWLGITGGPGSFQDNSTFDTGPYPFGEDLEATWDGPDDDSGTESEWPTTYGDNNAYVNQEDRNTDEMQQWLDGLTNEAG